MINFLKKNLIKIIFAAFLVVVLIRLSLNYFGFCYDQKRFLSDEKKLNIVVKEILELEAESVKYYKRVILLDKNDERRLQFEKHYSGEPLPYRDINEFFTLNPKCCTVSDEYVVEGAIAHISRWSRLIRTISSVVTIKYLERYLDNEGVIQTKPVKHDWVLTNCGENRGDVMEHDNLWTHFE